MTEACTDWKQPSQPSHPLGGREGWAESERVARGLSDQPSQGLTSTNIDSERVERVTPYPPYEEKEEHTHIRPRWTQPSHPLTLSDWLTRLQDRGVGIEVRDGAPTFAGDRWRADAHDADMLARHRHALTLAAAGTHPTWWAWISGRSEVTPGLAELPLVGEPGPELDTPHACATCGGPSITMDADGLAWCTGHGGAG